MPANIGPYHRHVAYEEALMSLNDRTGEGATVWLESPRGEPMLIGAYGVLSHVPPLHSRLVPHAGDYNMGPRDSDYGTTLALPAGAAIAQHSYGLCFRDRHTGVALIIRCQSRFRRHE